GLECSRPLRTGGLARLGAGDAVEILAVEREEPAGQLVDVLEPSMAFADLVGQEADVQEVAGGGSDEAVLHLPRRTQLRQNECPDVIVGVSLRGIVREV